MLVNDPAVPDPKNPSQLDPNMFKGKSMTYYGRWTYKYEIASRKGAAAAVIIHETGPRATLTKSWWAVTPPRTSIFRRRIATPRG